RATRGHQASFFHSVWSICALCIFKQFIIPNMNN
ncbi:unnamed protein product, partial [Brassica oleracea]